MTDPEQAERMRSTLDFVEGALVGVRREFPELGLETGATLARVDQLRALVDRREDDPR